ncbi:MAG: hypothetical protein ACREPI_04485 [Candidatus Dormibacterales bacterium]
MRDIGSFESSIDAVYEPTPFDHQVDWGVLGVDIFSRALLVRLMLTGTSHNTLQQPAGFFEALAASGPDGPLEEWGGAVANTFSEGTASLVLLAWFQRSRSVPWVRVQAGGRSAFVAARGG